MVLKTKVKISYNKIEEDILSKLRESTINNEKINFKNVEVYPSKNGLVLGVFYKTFDNNILLRRKGVFYVKVDPKLISGKNISFANFEIKNISDSNFLDTSVRIVGMVKNVLSIIKKDVSDYNYSYKKSLDDVKHKIASYLNKKYPNEIRSEGKIEEMFFEDLSFLEDGIEISFNLSGKYSIFVD